MAFLGVPIIDESLHRNSPSAGASLCRFGVGDPTRTSPLRPVPCTPEGTVLYSTVQYMCVSFQRGFPIHTTLGDRISDTVLANLGSSLHADHAKEMPVALRSCSHTTQYLRRAFLRNSCEVSAVWGRTADSVLRTTSSRYTSNLGVDVEHRSADDPKQYERT